MAEREGFEPPIALRLWLISSQLHSTGLCHLSGPDINFTLPASGRENAALITALFTEGHSRAAAAHHQTATSTSPRRFHCFRGLRCTVHRHLRNLHVVRRLDPQLLTQLAVDPPENLLVLLEEAAHILASLPDALAAVAIPRSALLHDVVQHRQVQHIALARNALTVQNVELGIAERSRHLVLDDLHLRARANHYLAFLHCTNAANVDAHRRIKLQRASTRCRLRIAEHHANLFADLINED